MTGLLRSELYKILLRRMTLILAALIVVIMAFMYLAFTLAVVGSEAANVDEQAMGDLEALVAPESVPAFGDDLVWQIVAVMAVILVASAVGNEYSWRTILTTTTWTGRRALPFVARTAIVAVLAAVAVVIGFIVAVGGSVASSIGRGTFESDALSMSWVGDIGIAMLTTWYAVLVYVVIAALLAILGRGSGMAIGVSLALLFLEGLLLLAFELVGDSLDWARNLTLSWNVQAVMAANGHVPGLSEAPSQDLPSAWRGALMLALFMAAIGAIAIRLLQTRDINE